MILKNVFEAEYFRLTPEGALCWKDGALLARKRLEVLHLAS